MNSLTAGFLGACTLNLIHESARVSIPHAPHVDEIAMRGLNKMGVQAPRTPLRTIALAGDIVSNSLYYAAIGWLANRYNKKSLWGWAWGLGLAAGVGAVVLPPKMGLGQQPTTNMKATGSMTVAWYLLGALATAALLTPHRKHIDSRQYETIQYDP